MYYSSYLSQKKRGEGVSLAVNEVGENHGRLRIRVQIPVKTKNVR